MPVLDLDLVLPLVTQRPVLRGEVGARACVAQTRRRLKCNAGACIAVTKTQKKQSQDLETRKEIKVT